jgi:hypothetical protein
LDGNVTNSSLTDSLVFIVWRVARRPKGRNWYFKLKDKTTMKKVLAVLLSLAFCATAVFALDNDDSVVRWRSIAGVLAGGNTHPPNGIGNPVGNLPSGNFPWSIRSGHASVNLSTGATSFEVEGLVINGSAFSGTPGPVTAVKGTLVCNASFNPGAPAETVLDTTAVSLNVHGDAHFSGYIQDIPASCGNPIFLVRVAVPDSKEDNRWIATGIGRFIGDEGK